MIKTLLGVAAVAALALLPIWKDVETGGGQSGLTILKRNLVEGKVTKHLSAEEAILNAKARYYLGVEPRRYSFG